MLFFFFNDTATTEIYTLSLHDALPISRHRSTAGSTECSTKRPRSPPARPRRAAIIDLELSRKVAVVTGASKGIGLAVVRALAAEGTHVIAGARTVDALDGLD